MMKTIAPNNVVTNRGSPHIEPDGWRAVRRIYLKSSDATVVLQLYAGDTAEQAIPLFDNLSIERFRKLTSRLKGWEAEPNFHLGYWTKGFLHTRTAMNAFDYVRFWKNPPDDLGITTFKKKEYGKLAKLLKRYGMFSPLRLAHMHESITNRPWVSMRSGVKLTHTWTTVEPSAEEVVIKLNQAFQTWGEYVGSEGSGKAKKLRVHSVSR